MLIAAGTMLEGKYRIERLLGAGGMGSVWIAEHALLHRPVAVKVLDSGAASKDATAVQRFLREAQTAARLRSDHIVDVLDVGKFDDGTPFLVMELLEGETMAGRIKRVGRIPQPEASNLMDQLLEGLGAAHAAGVIHRDIKPDNCFITRKAGRDHVKLLDFGISKVAPTSPEALEMRMTRTGVVMGTPYYMAPEQARGAKEIDHRCDLYAVGAILYEAVTGRVPFDADSVNELLFKIVLEALVPPREIAPELDPAFEQLILKAMAREAVNRYQTAEAFRDAIAPYIGRTGTSISHSGERVVVSTPPPANIGASVRPPPISGNEQTAPIDSDAMREAMADARASARGANTPSQGLSATGPLHPTVAPRSRAGAAAFAGVVAILAIGGGIAYLATSRAEPVPATTSNAAIAPPPATEPQHEKTTVKPAIAQSDTVANAAPKPPEPTPFSTMPSTTTTAAASKGNAAAKPALKKVTASPPTANPTLQPAPPPPPPPPTGAPTTTKPGSPRPIDTAL